MLRGADVSAYQGDIDWGRVRGAGVGFAVVKATEGLTWRDPRFSAGRWSAMRAAGLIRGAYHFARPQPGRRGRDEAAYFASIIESVGGRDSDDLPLVLDLEWSQGLSATGVVVWSDDFGAEIKRQTGRGCILYTGGFYKNLGQVRAPTLCGVLWIAHYGVPRPTLPWAWRDRDWTFWQYTSAGRVDGIQGNVDRDWFNGSMADLRQLCRSDRRGAIPPCGPDTDQAELEVGEDEFETEMQRAADEQPESEPVREGDAPGA